MSRPHCPTCGRWDGSHSTGCTGTYTRPISPPVCGLCGEYKQPGEDHSEAGHDGDGMEPCTNGHYGCSMSGKTGGPCQNEHDAEEVE